MRYNINVAAGFMLAIAFAANALFSQASKTAKPSFEVASVKRTNSGANPGSIGAQGDRFTANNTTLTMLVQFAYRRPTDQRLQVFGAPGWMDSEHFDIEAKSGGESRRIPQDEMRLMLQSLLEDRFQLKMHRETREFPVYTLAVAKDGPKFKPSPDQSQPLTGPPVSSEQAGGIQTPFGVIRGGGSTGPPTLPRGSIRRIGSDLIGGTAVDFSFFVSFLSQQLGRPVIDKTDLKGLFDFKLHYIPDVSAYLPGGPAGPDVTPPAAGDPSGASIFTAVQEIGLKLESSKGPVEVLVIDSVQKPTEN